MNFEFQSQDELRTSNPVPQLRIPSRRAANFEFPSCELRIQSRNHGSRATELQTSNFRATNFESSPVITNPEPPSCELRISSPRNKNPDCRAANFEFQSCAIRTSNPRLRSRAAEQTSNFQSREIRIPSRQAAKFESSQQISSRRAVNFEFQSHEYKFPRSLTPCDKICE